MSTPRVRQKYTVAPIGRKYGRWTVIGKGPDRITKGRGQVMDMWICRCECGTERVVTAQTLATGRTKGCGCYQGKHLKGNTMRRKAKGEFGHRQLFKRYQETAVQKGHCFELTWEQFKTLTTSLCFYCGSEGEDYKGGRKKWGAWGTFTGCGVDRYDNDQGYTASNSVPCCKTCNFLKVARHGDEFIEICRRIAKHQRPASWNAGLQLMRVS